MEEIAENNLTEDRVVPMETVAPAETEAEDEVNTEAAEAAEDEHFAPASDVTAEISHEEDATLPHAEATSPTNSNPEPVSTAIENIVSNTTEVSNRKNDQLTIIPVHQAPQVGEMVMGPGGTRELKLFTPAKLTLAQQDAIAKAKKFAMEQSVKNVLLKQTLVHQQQMQMQNVIARPFTVLGSMQITDQVWTKLGTIYVGGISFEVREDMVKTAFQPFGPIKNVSLSWDAVANKHKGFAFVEYDVPEAASLALEQMNNVVLGGRTIKIGRPTNMPQAQPIIERLIEEAKPYNRVYIASIHPDLNENDIQSVFEAFGKIKSCKLAPDMLRPGKHRGYAFIEYDSAQAVNDAVASMNLFNLGGQYLRVGRAVTPPNTTQVPSFPAPMPTAAAAAAAAVSAKITALDTVLPMAAGLGTDLASTLSTGLGTTSLGAALTAGLTGGLGVGLGLGGLGSALGTGFGTSLGAGLGFPGLGNPALTTSGFAPPGIAIPQLSGSVMPGVVIPQLSSTAAAAISQATVSQPGATPSVGGGLQAATAAASKIGVLQLTDAQKHLVEEDAGQTLAQQENMQISGSQARQMVMQKLLRNTETRVMILRNMVGPEDVDEDLESEVVDECSRYGNVNRVIIYQEKQSEADDAEVLVKIFVEFGSPSEVDKAIKALDARYFAGRQVRALPYDQALFDANELSG